MAKTTICPAAASTRACASACALSSAFQFVTKLLSGFSMRNIRLVHGKEDVQSENEVEYEIGN